MDDLRHLQQVLTGMVTEIDILCRRHGITYYLCGGNAIGAARHKGFIPWDDDFDIMMPDKDYDRFLEVARKDLPGDKWFVQEGFKDWPGQFSKVRLLGTYLEDLGEWEGIPKEKRGIFIDIFPLTFAAPGKTEQALQYFCDKIIISDYLRKKGYKTDSKAKKIMLSLSNIMRIKPVRKLVHKIVYRYRDRDTGVIALFGNDTRLSNYFIPKEVYGKPRYVAYEDIELPAPADLDSYLRINYGDYMSLPPESERRPKHSIKVDFGSY